MAEMETDELFLEQSLRDENSWPFLKQPVCVFLAKVKVEAKKKTK